MNSHCCVEVKIRVRNEGPKYGGKRERKLGGETGAQIRVGNIILNPTPKHNLISGSLSYPNFHPYLTPRS